MKPHVAAAALLSLALALPSPLRAEKPAKEVVSKVSGRVMLDADGNGKLDDGDKGLAKVLVSDGVQFVRTDADGAFTLKFADDPLIPYKPAQVLTVCWPSGTWPVGRYHVLRGDLEAGKKVEFLLREQKQKLPFTFAHGTDPHDNSCGGELFAADVAGMGDAVKFCLMTGDLGYASRDGAEKAFTSLREATLKFPVPMLHVPGNHDVCDIHGTRWSDQDPLAGYGPYTRHLGPIRYSFTYADVHFVGLDWARITKDGKLQTGMPDGAIDWLKKDLAQLKPGTRIFVYAHHDYRHDDDKFYDVLVEHKVELVIAGHSHRNKEESRRGIKRLTTQNLCGPYRLVTVGEKSHSIVNRCFAGSAGGHQHSYAGQCKMAFDFRPVAARRGKHVKVADQEVKGSQGLDGFEAKELEVVAEVSPAKAKKFGLRLGKGDSATEFALTDANEFLTGDVRSPSVRGRGEKRYRIWAVVAGGKLVVRVNNRVQYEKPLTLKDAVGVELFAEGGAAVFEKVDCWTLEAKK